MIPLGPVAVCLILAVLPVVVVGVHQCYVCDSGAGSVELKRQFPKEQLPMCGRGEDAIKTCPPGYLGCLTATHKGGARSSGRVARSCGELQLNECKKANGVDYCYCSGELCNREKRSPVPPISPALDDDDEDLGEGEGSGDTATTTSTTPGELLPPSPTPNLTPTPSFSPSLSLSLSLLLVSSFLSLALL